ncbi:hypothetical protein PVK06_041845 [Gossypium arboreum]|uniref:RNase H type-1 domain-containing protein n=1 Tax=Gossypium arboreum TaxID=29729 RepID=A0ABR0N9C2_GOSAR|nr:hypothetical protein PVK06_041845 [Gossypium arboreum]
MFIIPLCLSNVDFTQGSVSWAIQIHSCPQGVPFRCLRQSSETRFTKERVFLNTDGVVQLDTGFAAAGGIVRDKDGNWIAGFHRFIGKCSVFDAELWGIFDGLRLVQKRGHNQVIILSDSLEVVKAITESSSTSSNSALIRRIHTMLSQETRWILRFILREQNQVTDCLAKQALIEKANMQVFEAPPEWSCGFIDRDRLMSDTLTQLLSL